MKSILDVSVSCFDGYRDIYPQTVNLYQWLVSDRYASKVNAIRSTSNKDKRKKLKADLPAITVSGIFHPTRKERNLQKHSGLICLDIDRRGNEHLDIKALKHTLFKWPYIAFSSLSVSGQGLFVIVPIDKPHLHTFHFYALQEDLKEGGIIIDDAPKNVASLRGYSYDPDRLIRHRPEIYTKALPEKPVKRKTKFLKSNQSFPQNATQKRVEALIEKIIENRIDITAYEPDWFRIACALANEFGEQGREYFHLVSQFHPLYLRKKTNQKFDQALRRQYSKLGIGTFFSTAKYYGIDASR